MPKIVLYSQFFKCEKHIVNYIRYLARQGELFSGLQDVDLNDALRMVQKYSGTTCWRHIYSLTSEDVNRLQLDRNYMKALMESQKNEIAKALHISPENLILYASYHETAHHPHLHFVMRSKIRREGFVVAKKGQSLDKAFEPSREKIKSSLTNQIFREDLLEIKVQKANTQKALNEQTRIFLELGKNTHFISAQLNERLNQLAQDLSKIQGKKVYGYLPPELKQQVDDILQLITENDPNINTLFLQYQNSQRELIFTYAEKPETVAKKINDWKAAFYHPQKGEDTSRHNLIIRYALTLKNPQRYTKKKSVFSNKKDKLDQKKQSANNQKNKKEFTSHAFDKKYQSEQVNNNTNSPPNTPSDQASFDEQSKEKKLYHHKSNQAAIRSMLYQIGYSLHQDKRRLSAARPYPKPKPKHRIKKIQKEVQIDQQNHIEAEGML